MFNSTLTPWAMALKPCVKAHHHFVILTCSLVLSACGGAGGGGTSSSSVPQPISSATSSAVAYSQRSLTISSQVASPNSSKSSTAISSTQTTSSVIRSSSMNTIPGSKSSIMSSQPTTNQSSTQSPANSSKSSQASTPSQGDALTGKMLYDAQCTTCHGIDGKGIYSLNNDVLNFSAMVVSINKTMPQTSPGTCDVTCAADITQYIKTQLFKPTDTANLSPGYVMARRLNRIEYDNTIVDLFGFDKTYKPSAQFNFTQDEFRFGFNNNAQALTISVLDAENYFRAAKDIANKALTETASRQVLMLCEPTVTTEQAACLTKILNQFLPKAYRRAITDADRTALIAMADAQRVAKATFADQVKLVVTTTLMMPDFLFRFELDSPADTQAKRALSSYEIANRLSYFLWSSMPDAELMRLASTDGLKTTAAISAQVERMMKAPRSESMWLQLSEQWLQTLSLSEVIRSEATFNDALRNDIKTEVELLMKDVVLGVIPVKNLLNNNYSYLTKRLATLYQLPNAASLNNTQPQAVTFADNRRGGLLTTASFLMITAHPTHNSPVKRGKWVLERLLFSPPPPPPANVPPFDPEVGAQAPASLRTQTETFFNGREACNTCHKPMHNIGFSFEHYDVMGRWREQDNSFAIDDSGSLPNSNVTFAGVPGLVNAVVVDSRFSECIVEKVFTYALGRDLVAADKSYFQSIAQEMGASMNMPDLLRRIATSPLMIEKEKQPK